jgi:peptidoglycan/LPS O-acetylase OafA/YrhL
VTPGTATDNRTKFFELESIRGLAALLVVFYHMPSWNAALLDVGFIRNGYLMVELFFVLSGFVIYNAYAASITTAQQLWRFQLLRLGRLYPVHLLFLLFYLGVEVTKYLAYVKMGATTTNTPFRENGLTAFLQQILLLHAVGPTGNSQTFNIPSWSISVEFYTYLLFGAVVLVAKSKRNYLFATLFLLSITLLASHAALGFSDLLKCTTGFFLGCLIGVLNARADMRVPASLSALALIALAVFLQFKSVLEQDLLIYACSALLILGLVRSQRGLVKRVLNWRVLTWLGTISYSIYMAHSAVLWVLNQLLRGILQPNAFTGTVTTPQLSAPAAAVVITIAILVVLAASQLTYMWIEKPLREWSRKVILGSTRSSNNSRSFVGGPRSTVTPTQAASKPHRDAARP